MRTRLRVSGGTPDQDSAGDVFAPSHVWMAGMGPPDVKSGEVTMDKVSYQVASIEGPIIYIDRYFSGDHYKFDRRAVVEGSKFCSPVIFGEQF